MNRIDRISAILVLLQSRPVVRAADMSERFDVSLRTIYRDIHTLSEAGVPICGDSGIGYSLIEGYRLPPLMFTVEEALAFVTAEKFIEQLADEQSGRCFCSGMDKIRAVLRAVDRNDLADVGKSIEVYRNKRLPTHKVPDLLQTILGSIHQKLMLTMRYFTPSRNEYSDRQIEAVGVSYIYPHWHLTAYCHYRKEYRNFRLDRIEELTLTDKSFSREHPPLSELGYDCDNNCLTRVVVHTTAETSIRLGDRKYYYGLTSEKLLDDGRVEQVYMSYSVESMARFILSQADTMKVVEPQEVIDRIREIISNI